MTDSQQENVALVRVTIEAYNTGEVQRMLDQVHPEIEIFTGPGMINEGRHRGPDGLLRWMEEWNEAWEEFQISLERVEAVGDRHVIADVLQTGRGRGSGMEIEGQVGHVYEFEDGVCTRFHLYASLEEARAAVEGLAAGGPFRDTPARPG